MKTREEISKYATEKIKLAIDRQEGTPEVQTAIVVGAILETLLDIRELLIEQKQTDCRADKSLEEKEYILDAVRSGYGTTTEQKHQHVSDGMVYMSNPPKYRCVVCGEFF